MFVYTLSSRMLYEQNKREMYQGASQINAPENASLFDRRSQILR